MPVRRGRLIRPLLFAGRARIVAYARRHGLAWREDRSNAALEFQRNRVRHRLMPLLAEFNPQIERTLGRLAATMEEAHFYLEHRAEEALRACLHCRDRGKIILEIEPFLAYFTILQKYMLRLVLRLLDEDDRLLDQEAWKAIRQYLAGRDPRSPLRLSAAIEIWKWRDRLVVQRSPAARSPWRLPQAIGRHRLPDGGRLEIRPVRTALSTLRLNRDPAIVWIDAGRLRGPLRLRPPRPGDRFKPLGMKQETRLSKFIGRVPPYERAGLVVLESGGRVVWLCGWRLDERFKVTEKTTTLYRLKWFKHEI
jgi:tRNA(Ile)-lysidine synthase